MVAVLAGGPQEGRRDYAAAEGEGSGGCDQGEGGGGGGGERGGGEGREGTGGDRHGGCRAEGQAACSIPLSWLSIPRSPRALVLLHALRVCVYWLHRSQWQHRAQ